MSVKGDLIAFLWNKVLTLFCQGKVEEAKTQLSLLEKVEHMTEEECECLKSD